MRLVLRVQVDGIMMMTRLVSCTIGVALALSSCSASTAFVVPCPRATSLRTRAADSADVETAVDDVNVVQRTEPCEGYPKCDGAYRDKGCDGSGRIAGGVGAVLPWFPVKAFRPCPSFTEAKYKYDRSGQSLNEVMFAGKKKRNYEPKDASDTAAASDSTNEEVQ